MLATLVLISSLLYGAHATSPFTTSVDCTAQGFKPSFSFDGGQTAQAPKILAATLVLGDSSVTETNADAWCKGSVPASNNPASQTAAMSLTASTLDATKYTNANNGGIGEGYLPYQQGTNGVVGTTATRCGGTLEHFDALNEIIYEVNAKVIIKRKFRNTVIRTTSYPFVIRCNVERALGPISSQKGFKVKTALVDETWDKTADGEVFDDFAYAASLKLYTDQSYGTAAAATVEVDNNAKVYIRVEQGADQPLFKFVVDECYATVGNDNTGAVGKDTFWMNKCRRDSTVTGAADQRQSDGATMFKIEMNSFYFPADTTADIFFHCKLTVCLASTASTDAKCSYPTDCATANAINEDTSGGAKRRRRRSAEESGFIGSKIITSSQSVIVNQAQVFAPSCGNGFIYDRVLGGCSNENLVEINGIYLGAAAWDPAYANITSDAFKTMAAAREYQLWVLLQVTQRTEYIRGLKIIRARQGSVILDAVIRHAPSVSAEEAFFQLEQALQTKPSVTRVMNLLQIREGKTIELVPIVVAGQESDTEKLILIVVVVVLFVLVSIAGVTLFKVRQGRQQPASTTASFDNKGVDA